MTLKTCHKCGQQKLATTEFFLLKTKRRKDGTINRILTSPCKVCAKLALDAKKAADPEKFTQQATSRVLRWRERNGREDRTVEYLNRKAKRAGFTSVADYQAHAAALAALPKPEKKKTTGKTVCWLWNKPGIGDAEKFAIRYRLDAEFREKQKLRTTMAKMARAQDAGRGWTCGLWENPALTPEQAREMRLELDPDFKRRVGRERLREAMRERRIKQATPPWADQAAIAAVYASRPDGFHVDHFVPLRGLTPDGARVSGLHVHWNLRHLPARDNELRQNLMTEADLRIVEAGQMLAGLRTEFANR